MRRSAANAWPPETKSGVAARALCAIGPGCLSAKCHQIKAIERVNQLRKLRNRTDLSSADRATLEELIADLEDALGTPRVGP